MLDSRTPALGAKVVARAWVDPDVPGAAARQWPHGLRGVRHHLLRRHQLIVLENTETVHNLIVCTLCSCYPRPVLGLPPDWYKLKPYRARAVSEPRAVLAEFGTIIPDDVEVRVSDSTAMVRYLVLPMRPEGTENYSEERARSARHPRHDDRRRARYASKPENGAMTDTEKLVNRLPNDIGGLPAEPIQRVDHELEPWEKRCHALADVLDFHKIINTEEKRCGVEALGAEMVGKLSYYERWIVAFANILFRKGILTPTELATKMKEVEARWAANQPDGA